MYNQKKKQNILLDSNNGNIIFYDYTYYLIYNQEIEHFTSKELKTKKLFINIEYNHIKN